MTRRLTNEVERWTDLEDARDLAQQTLDTVAWDFLMGGSEGEGAVRFARAAYEARALIPRVLTGVSRPALATTVMGMTARAPLCTCPIGIQAVFHPDGEKATVSGAGSLSIPAVVSCMSSFSFPEIAETGAEWAVQIYPFEDRTLTLEILDAALDAGAQAVVYTADLPTPGRRLRDLRNGFTGLTDVRPYPHSTRLETIDIWSAWSPTYTWEDVGRIADRISVPFAIKGILRPDDAVRAVDVGATTIWVSSHGGRQLDDAVAPLEAVAAVADAVGDTAELIIDGGPLSGADVAKALALGARAVAIGRPVVWGLAAGGMLGVRRVLSLLVDQLENVLVLMGAPDASSLSPSDVATLREFTMDSAVTLAGRLHKD